MRSSATAGERRRSEFSTTEDLGRANAASVLTSVLTGGPLARSEIADRLGLTRATVTRVSNRLIDLGLVSEGKPRRDAPGRPTVPLTFDGGNRVTVAVHFGALESRVGVVDLQGRVLAEGRDGYDGTEAVQIVGVAADRVNDIMERLSARHRFVGVGVSLGGWVDADSGEVIRFAPLGWSKVPVAKLLRERTGLPVRVDQMVRGLAMAEKSYGAVRGATDFLEMWVGNIVGAAIVRDGTTRTTPGGVSGILTHFPVRGGWGARCECGREGCLVHNIGDKAVVAEAIRRGLVGPEADIHALMSAAKANRDGVREFVGEIATMAGEAAAAMVDLISPPAVVAAGLVTTAPGYLDAFRSSVQRYAELGSDTSVHASAFGDLAPTIASASVMLDSYFRDPLKHEA